MIIPDFRCIYRQVEVSRPSESVPASGSGQERSNYASIRFSLLANCKTLYHMLGPSGRLKDQVCPLLFSDPLSTLLLLSRLLSSILFCSAHLSSALLYSVLFSSVLLSSVLFSLLVLTCWFIIYDNASLPDYCSCSKK